MALGVVMVLALLLGPDIAARHLPSPPTTRVPATALLNTGVLVFREGLEAVLTLAVVAAGLSRERGVGWRPVAAGAALGFGATLLTWSAVVALISAIGASVPELDLQAATGMLAVVVLVVVMNWFFHKLYWEGWLSLHSRKKRELAAAAGSAAIRGLALLGFASVYREGFEVVLFLQNIRLQAGPAAVAWGAGIGLGLTLAAGLLTFAAHRRLPFQKLLLLTGGMLGVVFVVMVGEQVQEMQQAGWLGSSLLYAHWPAWLGVWLSVSPTIQGFAGQGLAAAAVVGSYVAARRRTRRSAAAPLAAAPAAVSSASG